MESIQRDDSRVLILSAARRPEQSERRVVTQPKIQSKARTDAPRILHIEPDLLYVLRKCPVARRDEFASGREVGRESSRVRDIESWVFVKCDQRLGIVSKPAAQYWLVNEVRAELDRVLAAGARDIVTKLVLALIAQDRKGSDA